MHGAHKPTARRMPVGLHRSVKIGLDGGRLHVHDIRRRRKLNLINIRIRAGQPTRARAPARSARPAQPAPRPRARFGDTPGHAQAPARAAPRPQGRPQQPPDWPQSTARRAIRHCAGPTAVFRATWHPELAGGAGPGGVGHNVAGLEGFHGFLSTWPEDHRQANVGVTAGLGKLV